MQLEGSSEANTASYSLNFDTMGNKGQERVTHNNNLSMGVCSLPFIVFWTLPNGTIVSGELAREPSAPGESLLPLEKHLKQTSPFLFLDSTSNINGYLPVISTTVSFYLTWKGHLYCQAQLTCLTLTQRRKLPKGHILPCILAALGTMVWSKAIKASGQ